MNKSRFTFSTVSHQPTEFEATTTVGKDKMIMIIRIGNYGDEDKTKRTLISHEPKKGVSTILWKSLTNEERKRVRESQMRYFQIKAV